MKHLATGFVSLLTLAAMAGGAGHVAAQSANERINMVIAYSEDECPPAKEGEVVICEIMVEADRYRIPKPLRSSGSPQNVSPAGLVDKIRYVGDFGAMSCDPAGAGGFSGCTQKFIEAAYKDRAESENVRFGQLIEEARQQRLSTIDATAEEEQKRVEMIEREYMERLERERAGELPGETTPPPPSPPSPADGDLPK